MKNLYATLLMAVATIAACSPGHDGKMTALYRQIDSAIAADTQGTTAINAHLASLKQQLANTRQARLRQALADSIFKTYSSYDNDSAVAWGQRSLSMARQLADPAVTADATLNLVSQYAKSGYFIEADHHYRSTAPDTTSHALMVKYYDVGRELYSNMGHSTDDAAMREAYRKRSYEMRSRLYATASRRSPEYLKNRLLQKLYNEKDAKAALEASDRWRETVKENTHDYAIMAYYRSEIFRSMGDNERRKEWLAKSAIADLRNSIMDQASLWTLASIIYREGDIDLAYKYMDYSWRCVSKFSSHKRAWDVTPILTVINSSYQQKTQLANRRLSVSIAFAAVLLALSLGLLIYVQHKRRQLGKAKAAIAESNRRLRKTVAELNRANAALHESDRVKDKYIGKFFSMCSAYIEKLDNFRSKVRRNLKAGMENKLMDMTDPNKMRTEEHKALMDNFDDIFLSLYPSFVDEFNALLKPDCQIRPSGKERMNATLRIFALIRLGITESSRIAEILGYSPTSIYNYRARAKNMAACRRSEFEERVKTPMSQSLNDGDKAGY